MSGVPLTTMFVCFREAHCVVTEVRWQGLLRSHCNGVTCTTYRLTPPTHCHHPLITRYHHPLPYLWLLSLMHHTTTTQLTVPSPPNSPYHHPLTTLPPPTHHTSTTHSNPHFAQCTTHSTTPYFSDRLKLFPCIIIDIFVRLMKKMCRVWDILQFASTKMLTI